LYDPSSGRAVQGYTAAANGTVTATIQPGSITIPIGLKAQGTGAAGFVKVGPNGDDVFYISVGGNLDVTQFVVDQRRSVAVKPAR